MCQGGPGAGQVVVAQQAIRLRVVALLRTIMASFSTSAFAIIVSVSSGTAE
jgi:hypothetical protein